jgi:hypothetical protein
MRGTPVKEIGAALFFATLLAALTLPIGAQTTEIAGVTITHDDIQQFLMAMHKALQPNDMTVPVIIDSKPASEMPPYDKQVHYDGIHQTSLERKPCTFTSIKTRTWTRTKTL